MRRAGRPAAQCSRRQWGGWQPRDELDCLPSLDEPHRVEKHTTSCCCHQGLRSARGVNIGSMDRPAPPISLYGPLPPGSGRRPSHRQRGVLNRIVGGGVLKSAAPAAFSFLWTLPPQFHTLLRSRRQNMKHHYRSEPVRKSAMVRDATHIGLRGWPRQKLTFFSPGFREHVHQYCRCADAQRAHQAGRVGQRPQAEAGTLAAAHHLSGESRLTDMQLFETEMDNFFSLFRRYLNDKAKGNEV